MKEFLSLSLAGDFDCRFWMKRFFFSQTTGIVSGPRVVRILILWASFLPFVQFPEKDNEFEEDNGELIRNYKMRR